jgi:Fic family protein
MRRFTTFIHEKPRWPEFSWGSEALTGGLAAARYRQGLLLGRMDALGFDLREEASLKVLTSDVVKSSAIEGEKLDQQQVRSSIARRLGLDVGGLVKVGRDVDGIVEMMLDATQGYEETLTAERLFGWHAALFPTGRSGLGRITVGAWRTAESGPMQVVSGPIGREKVHFEAPAADRLEKEMAEFLKWFNEETAIDPVLKAGVAHFWFETIHPFEDGNGRIGRAIADMLLARADKRKQRFYSMSSQIESERNEYYDQLESAQRNGLDITGWLGWFVGCLERTIVAADGMLESVLLKARVWKQLSRGEVNERQRVVVNRLLDDFKGFLTTSKYGKLAKCSQDTALRDIRELLDRGVLVQNPGSGRSTSYRIADPGEEAR